MNRRVFLGLTGAAGAGCLLPGCARHFGTARGSVSEADWRALAQGMAGELLRPDQVAYDPARVLYNARFDSVRPQAVARCASVDDVRAVIAFARRTGLPITPRGGGHSFAGYSTGRGIVMDLSPLRTIEVSTDRATIGSGARLIDIYERLTPEGVAIPGGSCPSVGIAGLTMGGGIGVFDRSQGLTIDSLVSAQVVTADGRVVTCDADRHPDLFWALRGGGGGNFGIATSFTFRTYRTRDVATMSAHWKVADGLAVFKGWQRWCEQLSDDIWTVLSLWCEGGELTVSVYAYAFGGLAALGRQREALIATVALEPTSQGSMNHSYHDALFQQIGCRDLTSSQCHLTGQTPDGQVPRYAFAGSSDFFERGLPDDGIRAVLQAMEMRRSQGRTGAAMFDLMGGAVSRVAPDATAFVHRTARLLLQYFSRFPVGTADAVVDEAAAWHTEMRALTRPWSNGHAYQNYIDPAIRDWKHAYYGSNYARLVKVKAAYDPDGVFRFPQGIPPR